MAPPSWPGRTPPWPIAPAGPSRPSKWLWSSASNRAQRHGDIDPAANARRHGRLLLAVLRGIEALGKANTDKRSLRSIAEAAHGDAVFPEAPQLLAQGIVQLACPLLVQKLHDLGAASDELIAVAPHRIYG